MIKILPCLNKLAKLLKPYAPLCIVGGYVRDSLLNIKTTDCDLCSCLTITELEQILSGSDFEIIITNKQFGTAKIRYKNKVFEYSTFRQDFYNSGGKHSPKKVEFVNSIQQDCLRRDFTINAIYFDITNKQIIDPFDAINDLKNRLIKAVPNTPETLSNDGERLLRLAKFKAKLNFEIDNQTLIEAKKYSHNLKELTDNTINKFLQSIKDFTNNEKQDIKTTLKLLNAEEIANKIKEV